MSCGLWWLSHLACDPGVSQSDDVGMLLHMTLASSFDLLPLSRRSYQRVIPQPARRDTRPEIRTWYFREMMLPHGIWHVQAPQVTPLPTLSEGEVVPMSGVELHASKTSPPDYLTGALMGIKGG